MTHGPAYLLGRVTGFLIRPLIPLAESALSGVLDGLFGEPDDADATYTPIPEPELDGAAYLVGESYDGPWTLDEERLNQIAGTA